RRRCAWTKSISHRLAHCHSCSKTGAESCAAAFVGSGDRNCLRSLELRVLLCVADDVHAHALVESLLQLVGQRKTRNLERPERESETSERRRDLLANRLR